MLKPSRRSSIARDVVMVALALFSIGLLIYDEMRHPVGTLRTALVALDLVIVVVFVAEFLYRWREAEDKGAFFRRTWYEIPGMVPMAAGELGFLRFFRLFRIIAMAARLWRAKRVAQSFLARSNLTTILGVTALLLFGCAYAEFQFEKTANPGQFANFGEALWWAIVTTTTVGYGDKFPITLGGRMVAGVLMLTGIGLIGTLAATLSNALIKPRTETPTATPAPRVEDRLAHLAGLHERGALTDDEFARAKDRVLSESS
jgi:voltage-gated potassium channel